MHDYPHLAITSLTFDIANPVGSSTQYCSTVPDITGVVTTISVIHHINGNHVPFFSSWHNVTIGLKTSSTTPIVGTAPLVGHHGIRWYSRNMTHYNCSGTLGDLGCVGVGIDKDCIWRKDKLHALIMNAYDAHLYHTCNTIHVRHICHCIVTVMYTVTVELLTQHSLQSDRLMRYSYHYNII